MQSQGNGDAPAALASHSSSCRVTGVSANSTQALARLVGEVWAVCCRELISLPALRRMGGGEAHADEQGEGGQLGGPCPLDGAALEHVLPALDAALRVLLRPLYLLQLLERGLPPAQGVLHSPRDGSGVSNARRPQRYEKEHAEPLPQLLPLCAAAAAHSNAGGDERAHRGLQSRLAQLYCDGVRRLGVPLRGSSHETSANALPDGWWLQPAGLVLPPLPDAGDVSPWLRTAAALALHLCDMLLLLPESSSLTLLTVLDDVADAFDLPPALPVLPDSAAPAAPLTPHERECLFTGRPGSRAPLSPASAAKLWAWLLAYDPAALVARRHPGAMARTAQARAVLAEQARRHGAITRFGDGGADIEGGALSAQALTEALGVLAVAFDPQLGGWMARRALVKTLVRVGLPPALRGALWSAFAGLGPAFAAGAGGTSSPPPPALPASLPAHLPALAQRRNSTPARSFSGLGGTTLQAAVSGGSGSGETGGAATASSSSSGSGASGAFLGVVGVTVTLHPPPPVLPPRGAAAAPSPAAPPAAPPAPVVLRLPLTPSLVATCSPLTYFDACVLPNAGALGAHESLTPLQLVTLAGIAASASEAQAPASSESTLTLPACSCSDSCSGPSTAAAHTAACALLQAFLVSPPRASVTLYVGWREEAAQPRVSRSGAHASFTRSLSGNGSRAHEAGRPSDWGEDDVVLTLSPTSPRIVRQIEADLRRTMPHLWPIERTRLQLLPGNGRRASVVHTPPRRRSDISALVGPAPESGAEDEAAASPAHEGVPEPVFVAPPTPALPVPRVLGVHAPRSGAEGEGQQWAVAAVPPASSDAATPAPAPAEDNSSLPVHVRVTVSEAALRRVLFGLASHVPALDYCQGYNFLASHALRWLGEADAFGLMTALVQGLLIPADYYNASLSGAARDQVILGEVLPTALPRAVIERVAGAMAGAFLESSSSPRSPTASTGSRAPVASLVASSTPKKKLKSSEEAAALADASARKAARAEKLAAILRDTSPKLTSLSKLPRAAEGVWSWEPDAPAAAPVPRVLGPLPDDAPADAEDTTAVVAGSSSSGSGGYVVEAASDAEASDEEGEGAAPCTSSDSGGEEGGTRGTGLSVHARRDKGFLTDPSAPPGRRRIIHSEDESYPSEGTPDEAGEEGPEGEAAESAGDGVGTSKKAALQPLPRAGCRCPHPVQGAHDAGACGEPPCTPPPAETPSQRQRPRGGCPGGGLPLSVAHAATQALTAVTLRWFICLYTVPFHPAFTDRVWDQLIFEAGAGAAVAEAWTALQSASQPPCPTAPSDGNAVLFRTAISLLRLASATGLAGACHMGDVVAAVDAACDLAGRPALHSALWDVWDSNSAAATKPPKGSSSGSVAVVVGSSSSSARDRTLSSATPSGSGAGGARPVPRKPATMSSLSSATPDRNEDTAAAASSTTSAVVATRYGRGASFGEARAAVSSLPQAEPPRPPRLLPARSGTVAADGVSGSSRCGSTGSGPGESGEGGDGAAGARLRVWSLTAGSGAETAVPVAVSSGGGTEASPASTAAKRLSGRQLAFGTPAQAGNGGEEAAPASPPPRASTRKLDGAPLHVASPAAHHAPPATSSSLHLQSEGGSGEGGVPPPPRAGRWRYLRLRPGYGHGLTRASLGALILARPPRWPGQSTGQSQEANVDEWAQAAFSSSGGGSGGRGGLLLPSGPRPDLRPLIAREAVHVTRGAIVARRCALVAAERWRATRAAAGSSKGASASLPPPPLATWVAALTATPADEEDLAKWTAAAAASGAASTATRQPSALPGFSAPVRGYRVPPSWDDALAGFFDDAAGAGSSKVRLAPAASLGGPLEPPSASARLSAFYYHRYRGTSAAVPLIDDYYGGGGGGGGDSGHALAVSAALLAAAPAPAALQPAEPEPTDDCPAVRVIRLESGSAAAAAAATTPRARRQQRRSGSGTKPQPVSLEASSDVGRGSAPASPLGRAASASSGTAASAGLDASLSGGLLSVSAFLGDDAGGPAAQPPSPPRSFAVTDSDSEEEEEAASRDRVHSGDATVASSAAAPAAVWVPVTLAQQSLLLCHAYFGVPSHA